ncbi:hypothetical protein PUNSTDRAFT_28641, partial [Punctularia strigosozonata HHB-11173 SS5]|uniref:uncharacterized protein n=1 Tax=Punctularia strigosozonata (strain HHB-11173) TaxID=741275 RepID=UPI0004416284
MCYVQGSIDQATAVCPMCKVYKPTGARCPHIRETCTNRANHPRGNVVYLKNPEVPTFKGCGYCKWANANPPSKAAGYNNAGWPGCCRPPREDDKRLISAADWLAVSLVHHVNIPADVRAALEGAGVKVPTIKVAASQGSPKGTSATITPTKPNASPRTTP